MVLAIGTHAVVMDKPTNLPKHTFRPFVYAYAKSESAEIGLVLLRSLLRLVEVIITY